MAQVIESTTQQFLDIHDVTGDLVIMRDGTVSTVLVVDAMNFGLLAEEEQDAVMYSYAGLLNSLNYTVQIVVYSKTKDVTGYLSLLGEQEEKTQDQQQRRRIRRYREFVGNLIQERNVLDKKFYVVIPATALELGFLTAQSVLPGSQPFDVNSVEKTVLLEKAQNVLDPRKDHLVAQFARIGLFSRPLNTQEIIKLFYANYNPESNEGQHIDESTSYTTPLVNAETERSFMINAQSPNNPGQNDQDNQSSQPGDQPGKQPGVTPPGTTPTGATPTGTTPPGSAQEQPGSQQPLAPTTPPAQSSPPGQPVAPGQPTTPPAQPGSPGQPTPSAAPSAQPGSPTPQDPNPQVSGSQSGSESPTTTRPGALPAQPGQPSSTNPAKPATTPPPGSVTAQPVGPGGVSPATPPDSSTTPPGPTTPPSQAAPPGSSAPTNPPAPPTPPSEMGVKSPATTTSAAATPASTTPVTATPPTAAQPAPPPPSSQETKASGDESRSGTRGEQDKGGSGAKSEQDKSGAKSETGGSSGANKPDAQDESSVQKEINKTLGEIGGGQVGAKPKQDRSVPNQGQTRG